MESIGGEISIRCNMATKVSERVYTIPLRSEWLKVPRNKRAKRAKSAIQQFLVKHLHASDVKISQMLNETLWVRGIEKPPAKVKVKVSIDDKGVVTARLPEEAILKGALEKKESKKGIMERAKDKVQETPETKPEKEEKQAEEIKPEIKPDIKEDVKK